MELVEVMAVAAVLHRTPEEVEAMEVVVMAVGVTNKPEPGARTTAHLRIADRQGHCWSLGFCKYQLSEGCPSVWPNEKMNCGGFSLLYS